MSGNRSNLGASDMGTCVQAGTVSVASPAMPGSSEIVSRNLAAAISEADLYVDTAVYPLSSVTLSSWSTTLSLDVF